MIRFYYDPILGLIWWAFKSNPIKKSKKQKNRKIC